MISTFLFIMAVEMSQPLFWFTDSSMPAPRAEEIVDESR